MDREWGETWVEVITGDGEGTEAEKEAMDWHPPRPQRCMRGLLQLCRRGCAYATAGRALASTPPGMPGTHPPIFWLGDVNGNVPQYYYVLSDIADQYWLPPVRSASSRFHSAIRRYQFASARQADSRLTRLVPPTLNSR